MKNPEKKEALEDLPEALPFNDEDDDYDPGSLPELSPAEAKRIRELLLREMNPIKLEEIETDEDIPF